MINIRKGSHHSKESREKIKNNHWSKSDDTERERIIDIVKSANVGKVPWNKGKEMTNEHGIKVKLEYIQKKL